MKVSPQNWNFEGQYKSTPTKLQKKKKKKKKVGAIQFQNNEFSFNYLIKIF